MKPATADDATTFDTLNRLRVTSCSECAMIFALPLAHYLNQCERASEIFCPAGHRIALTAETQSPAGLLLMNVQLLGEVAQVRHESATLQKQLKAVEARAMLNVSANPGEPMTDAERKRRVTLLANTARAGTFGERLCPFCATAHRQAASLRRHIMRRHLDRIDTPIGADR